jgi:hypothetical protein
MVGGRLEIVAVARTFGSSRSAMAVKPWPPGLSVRPYDALSEGSKWAACRPDSLKSAPRA